MQIFLLERIEKLVSRLLGNAYLAKPGDFPLMKGWCRVLYQRSSNMHNRISVEEFKTLFSDLDVADVSSATKSSCDLFSLLCIN